METTNWLIHAPAWHGDRPHGYVALKPLRLGSLTGSTRTANPGDVLLADEDTPALAGMVSRHDVAELPLDHGVLALIREQADRINDLEARVSP